MKHEPRQDVTGQWSGDLLVLLASAVLEAARFNAHGLSVSGCALTGCVVLAAIGVRWRLSRLLQNRDERSVAIMAVVLAFVVLPSAIEWALHAWFGFGQASEFHLGVWLRNFMLGTAATSRYRGHPRLSVLLSLFLIVLASVLGEDGLTWTLTAVYCLVGAWWLATLYWNGLKGHFITESKRRLPRVVQRRWLIVSALAVVVLFAVLAPILAGKTLGGARAATAIAGWFPTSGGTGEYDPFARAGVNDGDALVSATENAASVGPVESDVFLSTDQPSLYDVFNDMYGEPSMKPLDRAVSLDASRNQDAQEQKPAESKQLGREFSTLRNRPPKDKRTRLNDLNSPALLYVAGRTPLHLRVQAFNTFDGNAWTWRREPREDYAPSLSVAFTNHQPWVTGRAPTAFWQPAHEDLHVVKIVHLDTNHIPAPPHLSRLHIDKIDRTDFFSWAEGDVLQMTREKIPPFTIIHIGSQVAALDQLQDRHRPLDDAASSRSDPSRAVPQTERTAAIAELAKRWAGDAEPGWAQVAAIVSHLREEYDHAPDAVVPAECKDSVAHFLLDSQRGPDYLFASASTVLVRQLGYPARVVSGFYVAPENFDARSRHTPVCAQDVHFWAEVELSRNYWATIEATPGYEVLQPPATITERCLAALRAGWLWCWNRAVSLTAVCLALFGLVRLRRPFLDILLRCLWNLTARRSADACIWATVRLLDRRCRWAERPRPAFVTLARWYGGCDDADEAVREAKHQQFLAMLDWSFYAPTPEKRRRCAWSRRHIHDTCLWALRYWSLRRCHDLFNPSQPRIAERSTSRFNGEKATCQLSSNHATHTLATIPFRMKHRVPIRRPSTPCENGSTHPCVESRR